MPKIIKFKISNFKGIEQAEIDLEVKTKSPVLTLIGLNESGKTTVLEALSHFVTGDRTVSGIFGDTKTQDLALHLIPMHRKAAYTDETKIEAEVKLSNEDIEELKNIARMSGYSLQTDVLFDPFTVSKVFKFEDSALKGTSSFWSIPIYVKKGHSKTFSKYKRPNKQESDKEDLWLKCVNNIEEKLQQVVYFPTFLVDMPERIYLSQHTEETALNKHYRCVLQDILNSLDEGLTLERHVSNRILEYQKKINSPTWLSMLFGSQSKDPIDSVFQKISNAITKEVLGSWQRVFQRAISAKSISVDWYVDAEKDNLPYVTFHISDGESKFGISQRSLGFRWFFSFLLFTGFKKGKQRKTIFVFDEPAANLHAKAQAQLLNSFSKIVSDGDKIIYSTHSHHMINPQWLGSAYIVENAALDYDSSDNFGLDTKATNITITPYRQFVSKFSTRTSYFQPVIEKLEYIVPEIVGSNPFLIVEGISDYYAIILAKKISGKNYKFNILPGTGSGASGTLISQFLGQGYKFALLLDDDSEGNKAAKRYINDWYLDEERILTLKNIDNNFSGKALEKLFDNDTITFIKQYLQLKTKPSKKQIGWYLAEACARTDGFSDMLSVETLKDLIKILDYFEKKFSPP